MINLFVGIIIFFYIVFIIMLFMKKYKFIRVINVLVLFYYLILVFSENVKEIIKRNLKIFLRLENDICIEYSNNIYNTIEKYAWIIILTISIEIFYALILMVIYWINNRKQKKLYKNKILKKSDGENNRLYKNMYDYFSDKNNNYPILITGAWGTGKTKAVNDFFEKYYKYKMKKFIKFHVLEFQIKKY